MTRIPRFAKMGSTRMDILNKMYDELMADPTVPTNQICLDYCTCKHPIGSYPNFASIPSNYYNALIEHYVYQRVAYNSKTPANKDLRKVNFDFENHEVDENDPSLAIHSRLPDGTEIIWCWAGGDWEFAVSFVLYLDPKNEIRAYIPKKGNCYCTKCNTAWGTCSCGAQEPASDGVDYVQMYDDVINNIQTK